MFTVQERGVTVFGKKDWTDIVHHRTYREAVQSCEAFAKRDNRAEFRIIRILK